MTDVPEYIYEAYRAPGKSLTQYRPVPLEEFWKKAGESVILVALDEDQATYFDAMQLIEGSRLRIMSQKAAYKMDYFEWKNSTKFYGFNPQFGG